MITIRQYLNKIECSICNITRLKMVQFAFENGCTLFECESGVFERNKSNQNKIENFFNGLGFVQSVSGDSVSLKDIVFWNDKGVVVFKLKQMISYPNTKYGLVAIYYGNDYLEFLKIQEWFPTLEPFVIPLVASEEIKPIKIGWFRR